MTDSQSLNDATAEKRSFHAAEEGKLPVFAAGVSGNDEQLHAPPRVESPTMMMETTGGGAVPSFIRENDAQSILRQRAAAVGNNGGGLRSSSVPNLVGGRNQSLPHGTVVPGIQRKQTTLKAALLDNLEPKVSWSAIFRTLRRGRGAELTRSLARRYPLVKRRGGGVAPWL